MNKALLLLLVTLIQSQSNGVLLSGPNHSNKFDGNVEEFQLEGTDWDNSESPYTPEVSKEFNSNFQSYRKRSGSDVLTRRSILDKNFMRFGRNARQDSFPKFSRISRSGLEPSKWHFVRLDRGMRDNFIRFGRGYQDNFIRFGRGNKEGLIPFGILTSDEFLRSGKGMRDSFIRFGKSDPNFIKFGLGKSEIENGITRLRTPDFSPRFGTSAEKFDDAPDDFEKFNGFRSSENAVPNQTDGGNGTNLIRLLKQDGEGDKEEFGGKQFNSDESDKDMNLDFVIRIKRKTRESNVTNEGENETEKEKENDFRKTSFADAKHLENRTAKLNQSKIPKALEKRSATFFGKVPKYFPKKISRFQYENSWNDFESLRNQNRLTPPFFPVSSKF